MTPPAVAPPAPVSAPQTAAPPGSSGAPSGTASGGTSFGTILDSARTAVAEGHKETGKKAGDQHSSGKSSDGDATLESKAGAGELLAAAVAFLTGQAPEDPGQVAGSQANTAGSETSATSAGSPATAAGADAAASAAHSSAASATDASSPAAGASIGGDTGASSTAANSGSGAAAAPPAPTAGDQASASLPTPASGEPTSQPAAPSSGSAGDPQGTLPANPIATGAYKPQHLAAGSAASSGSTGLQRAAEVASSNSQAQAQAQAHAAQTTGGGADGAQEAQPAKHQDGAKPTVVGRQASDAAVASGASPATASSPGQTTPAGTTTAAASPASAGQSPAGSGGHNGTGADGHGASAGQQGSAPAAGTAPTAGAGSTPTNVFSVPASSTGQAVIKEGKLPDGLVRTAVTMQEAADAVKATFTAANQAGVSSARITLSPAELGGIRISLSQTADGLIARVATDHPEAAQTLQQSAGELKRSLEAGGMQLLRLDIGSTGQQGLGGFAGSQGDGSSATPSSGAAQSDGTEEDTASTPAELTIELASGSLVNVLA